MNLLDLLVRISAKDEASSVLGDVTKNAQDAASQIQKALDGTGDGLSLEFEALAAAAVLFGNSAENSASRARSAFQNINFSGVISNVSTAASAIRDGFQTAVGIASKAVEGLITVIGGIESVASSVAGAVKSAFEGIGSTIGSVASAVEGLASTLGDIASVIGGGVWSLSSSAVDSYADYEQLVGGVETLFGAGGRTLEEYADWKGLDIDEAAEKYNALLEAQEKVFANANGAYFTSGMSANDYMDTATFLSASLISALAGDTVEAADLIETAMVDMSDNANKFGSDLTSVTNAYKGFSKRNFTMLDNLKLGYGGTTGEMARLLNDANAIDSSILGEGVTLATSGTHLLDDIGLDQMIKAIHTIQEEMDITGTTTDEAMTTIQGSTRMAQAAWSDMMTAIADDNADFEGAIDKVVTSTQTALANLIPRIQQSLSGIAKLVEQIAPTVISTVPELISSALPGIASAISGIISATAEAIPGIAGAIVDALPAVAESFSTVGETLIVAVEEMAGTVIDKLVNAFAEFTGIDLTPITGALQGVVGVIGSTLSNVFDGINSSSVEVINGGIRGLGDAIQFVVDAVTSPAFTNLATTIWNSLSSIGGSLAEHMQPAIDAIGSLIGSFMSGDSGHIDRIKGAVENFTGIFDEYIAPIIGGISESVVGLIGSFGSIGVEVIDGIVNVLAGFFGFADDEEKTNRFQALAYAFGEILGSFYKELKPIIKEVKEAIENLFNYWFGSDADLDAFGDKLQKVKTKFKEINDKIRIVINSFWEWIDGVFNPEKDWEDAWTGFGNVVGAGLGIIINAVRDVIGWFENWEETCARLKALLDGIWATFKEMTTTKADAEFSIKEFEDLYGSKALTDEAKMEAAYEELAKSISTGLATGMINENSKVIKSMQEMLAKTENAAWEAIDAHSPSRRYMKLGGYMIEGLRLGWKNGMEDMLTEMRRDYAMMENLETPTTYAELRTVGGTALNRATADIANAWLRATATAESDGGTPVNLVVDGKTLATVLLDPLRGVLKQKGVTLNA